MSKSQLARKVESIFEPISINVQGHGWSARPQIGIAKGALRTPTAADTLQARKFVISYLIRNRAFALSSGFGGASPGEDV